MEAQPRGATVIYMCVDAHNYPSGRRRLQYKNGQYTACWSCAARSYFNQITIHYIYTQKKRQKKKKHSLLMSMHCAPNVSVKCCQFMFLEFLKQRQNNPASQILKDLAFEVQFVRNWGV